MPLEMLENVVLAPYTTFKVGGPARWFCAPRSREEFAEALEFSRTQGVPYFLLGKGSNLVVSDQGHPGLVVYTGEFNKICWENDGEVGGGSTRVTAQCGALLWDVVTQSVERGLRGMQNMAGIPGTLGGGTYINAGAFDQELKDVVTEVTSMNGAGALVTRSNAECQFGYRRSRFCEFPEWILETTMELQFDGNVEALHAEMEATVARRVARQPLHLPNAGSMFKRPPGNYAGALIEAAGLKGFEMGRVGISDKHANFTVNLGGATAQEIRDLTSEVILRVHAQSGITLEREPIFVGAFLPWPRA